MSGPKYGHYYVDEARYWAWVSARAYVPTEAERREAERLALARQQWQTAQQERTRLLARAGTLARTYPGLAASGTLPLGSPRSWTADDVAAGLARAADTSAALERDLDRLAREGRQAMAASIARTLGVESEGMVRVAQGAGTADDGAAAAATAARVMSRVDPEVDVPAALTSLVGEIASAPAGRRRVLVQQLRAKVDALNTEIAGRRRARAEQAAALARLAERAEQLDDAPLRLMVASAQTEYAAGGTVDVARIEATAAATERRREAEAAELRRTFVEETVVAAFARLGYDVVPGVSVRTPSAGVLVRHRASPSHAVRLAVTGGTIDLAPVRLVAEGAGSPRSAAERAEDVRAEEALCADAMDERSPLWRELFEVGVGARVQSVKPGVVPLPAVEVASELLAGAHRSRRSDADGEVRRA